MFNKRKVLYSAMVATLLSHAGGVMAAAGLDIDSDTTTGALVEVAAEEVSSTGTTNASGLIKTLYTTSGAINADFNMIYTLSGGATWGTDLSSSSLAGGTGVTAAITRVSGGTKNDSSVTFLIQAGGTGTSIQTGNTFSLGFTVVDKVGVLSSAGGDIKLTADLVTTFGNVTVDSNTAAADKVETVLKSTDGEQITFTSETKGAYLIDVAAGGTSFANSSGAASTTAKLGTIYFKDNTSARQLGFSALWTFAGVTQTGGTLLVTDAPFNASVTGGTGKVFIDVAGNGVYDAPESTTDYTKDFLAKEVTDSDATWEFSTDALKEFQKNCAAVADKCAIVIQADGTTTIEDHPSAPTAMLNIKYATGAKEFSSKLLQIKRNGTVCKLYNIPASNAVDELSIRVTNTSSQEGVVKGTLQALDGTTIFTNEDLIPALASNATVRVDAAALKVLAGGTDWTGRAVLTLSSNIKDGSLEVFSLVRNKAGGPLMNLSGGASGNGCD